MDNHSATCLSNVVFLSHRSQSHVYKAGDFCGKKEPVFFVMDKPKRSFEPVYFTDVVVQMFRQKRDYKFLFFFEIKREITIYKIIELQLIFKQLNFFFKNLFGYRLF